LVQVKDIVAIMEESFPTYLAESWDNSGLQIGSKSKEVKRLLIALDLDQFVLQEAQKQQVDMIITHHPLLLKSIKNIDYNTALGKMIKELIIADITLYTAHTNLDSAEQGLNQVLAERLSLINIRPLYKAYQETLFKLVVFVPISHIEPVREAIARAGGGSIGRYSDCSFRSQGTGTFRPGNETKPYIGQIGKLEEVDEYRLETIVGRSDLNRVLNAMLKAHPYEEVAYDIFRLENQGPIFSPGRRGNLIEQVSLRDYALSVKTILRLDSVRVVGDLERKVQNIAVISGSGASLMGHVLGHNIDLLVTGDLKYHEAKEAEAAGLAIIDAGHQGTEAIAVPLISEYLGSRLKNITPSVELVQFQSPSCIKNI
jgi:dinuclear metal center YbgI/SA1388 family protein